MFGILANVLGNFILSLKEAMNIYVLFVLSTKNFILTLNLVESCL